MNTLGKFLLITFSAAISFAHAEPEGLEESLANSLQSFAQNSVSSIKLACSQGRGPASISKTYVIEYRLKNNIQSLQIETESHKIKSVALVGDSIEFSRWKTFIPEIGKFSIDAVGENASVSELIMNHQKPEFVKALEALAPQAVDCCSSDRCQRRYKD